MQAQQTAVRPSWELFREVGDATTDVANDDDRQKTSPDVGEVVRQVSSSHDEVT